MSFKKISDRLLLLALTIMLIPAIPIFVIFGGTNTPEYVINGTLNIQISENFYPLDIYLESLTNLLTFNLGTSTASGQSVVHEVVTAFMESSIIMIPALVISLLIGSFIFYKTLKYQQSILLFDWICFVPMVAFSYFLLFVLDKIGIDVTSNVKYILAIIVLAIYPTYIVHNSFTKRFRYIVESDFYRVHKAFGFPTKVIIKKFLLKYLIIEYLSLFENIFFYIFGFIFFVESPMGINGIGNKFVWSIQRYDYPMIIGFCVFSVIILTVVNVITDTLLFKIDKRR